MQRWEYRVEEMELTDRWTPKRQAEEIDRFQARLGQLGDLGWEMISYESIPVYGGIMKNKLKGYAYLTFLKRHKD